VSNGVRCKFLHTFTISGLSADIFISLSGLTEAELPKATCPSGVLILAIKGLIIGGGGVTVGDKWTSFVGFFPKERYIDQTRYRVIGERVVLPFIGRLRANFDDWDGDFDALAPTMKVVSWQDGDFAQIANIVDDPATYAKHDVIANRHNPARTMSEQSAGAGRVFCSFHATAKETTVVSVAVTDHPLKRCVTKVMHEQLKKGVLNLAPPRKGKAMIDLVSSSPAAYQKSVTTQNIRHGGVKTGQLDVETKRYPCFNGTMHTLGHDPCQDEYNLVRSTILELAGVQIANGHISKDEYARLGYPLDKDADGGDYRRMRR
jgi:hypothetical protein